MFWWLRELFSSLQFLFVFSGQSFLRSKRVYEIVLPLTLTTGFTLIQICFPHFFSAGFVRRAADNAFQFMVFLVPFHLAALGAFATFQRPVLDELMKGGTAELKVWDNNDQKYEWKDISLRQYTSLLFGYLCTIGLIYIFFYIVASAVDWSSVNNDYINSVKFFISIVLVFFMSHYVLLSVYAITFLFDKVNGISQKPY